MDTRVKTAAPVTPRISMFDAQFLRPALIASLKRLAPQYQWRNPVIFVC
jgi:high-affinity K+ transport system ATPase subunit B